jgi:hypothetical protein
MTHRCFTTSMPSFGAWFRGGGCASAAAAGLLAAGCASAPPAADVPAALQPAGERAAFTLFARGVQIYECRAAAGAAPAWAFVAPEAELLEKSGGAAAGTHGEGPFWRSNDGSQIVGRVAARADAPVAGAIPWLLLSTMPSTAPGRMASISSVQRIHTVGGVAPTGGCTAADVGKRARVPYTSDYVFLVKAG